MEEAVRVENSNMSLDFGINPLKRRSWRLPSWRPLLQCQQLPPGLGPGPTLRSLDLCVLEAKIQFVWSDHLLIAIFIGPKPRLGFLQPWLEALNSESKQGKVSFNHEVGAHILLSQVWQSRDNQTNVNANSFPRRLWFLCIPSLGTKLWCWQPLGPSTPHTENYQTPSS